MRKWNRSDRKGTGHPWKEEGGVRGLANKAGGPDGVITGSHSSKCSFTQAQFEGEKK